MCPLEYTNYMSLRIIKTINSQNLVHNINYLKSLCYNNEKIYGVVKSNAYGHGLKIVAQILENYVNGFCVATNEEALSLRKLTQKPIIVLGAMCKCKLIKSIENDIEFIINNNYELKLLSKISEAIKQTAMIHLKVDTGMHRLGYNTLKAFKKALKIVQESKFLCLKGVCSHIGGDNANRTSLQAHKFENFACLSPTTAKSLANSQTFLSFPCLRYDINRIGIALYGYGDTNLKPVMEIRAQIVNILNIKKGSFVGYGTHHIAKKNMRIAVVAIGYADGISRIYAKRGFFLVNGKKARICANVCMNMTIIDITKIPSTKIGDYATILGASGTKTITATDIAKRCGTIEYEILTNFSNIKAIKK